MEELTGFQRDLLYVIAGLDEPHGLGVKEELEHYYGTEINPGRLYPNLDALVDAGLVRKGTRDRRTNTYEITPDGADHIEARQEWKGQYLSD